MTHHPSPLKRSDKNPIISPSDMPVECSAVFNPGAVRFGEEALLVLRVEDYARINHFHLARSRDGINFTVDPEGGRSSIWLSYSHDLIHWGDSHPRRGYMRVRGADVGGGVAGVLHEAGRAGQTPALLPEVALL